MNDTAIKNFAIAARRQLLDDVRLQMKRWAIDEEGGVPASADTLQGEILTPQQRRQRAELLSLCKAKGEDQLAEQAAYTWFNRFLAIRFMELHDYLPCGLRFFSSPDGSFDPQVLKEALQADIEGVDRARVVELVRSSDDEALFRYLFIAQCNELASCMPVVFERVGSAMELLLPESLLREGSILDHMVSDIPEDDWREGVEIVGWMYQYYVSERKDEVFASFKKGKKAERDAIAPATQLFTPNWIVRYLVENSLGRLWMLNHPDSGLKDRMKYFIAPDAESHEEFKRVSSPEEITVCDPACGSGHILVYAFELLAAMYEESGYMRRDIPRAILENNLSGMEIDPRAGALASFALTMKALEMDSRFLRREVKPDIKVLEPVSFAEEELELVPEIAGRKALLDALEHMDECGSLYEPDEEDLAALKIAADRLSAGVSDLFADSATEIIGSVLADCEALARRFDVVVANPPYMGSSNMGKWLAAWTKKHYPDSKRDLCTCFIERCMRFAIEYGYSSTVTSCTWMFISSFSDLRKRLIEDNTIISLLHTQGPNNHPDVFDANSVMVLSHHRYLHMYGDYFKLNKLGLENKERMLTEAIQNPNCGWFYRRKAQDFKSIPGTPIAYWASKGVARAFEFGTPLGEVTETHLGMATCDNERFLRLWWESGNDNSVLPSEFPYVFSAARWVPYNKGGSFRKWSGNDEYLLDWQNNGKTLIDNNAVMVKDSLRFKPMITWTRVSSGSLAARFKTEGYMFDMTGPAAFGGENDLFHNLAFLNSSVAKHLATFMSASLDFQPGQISLYPLIFSGKYRSQIIALCRQCIALSNKDWDDQETSWNFEQNLLVNNECESATDVNRKLYLKAKSYFDNLDESQIIARYYTPGNVRRLIEQRAVYFHPVDQYRIGGDPNENRAPEAQYAGSWPRRNPKQREVHECIHEYKKRLVKPYVSCWTKFEDENKQMWAEYGQQVGSICLVSTVGKVLSALSCDNVYAREIAYIPEDSYNPHSHEPDRSRVTGAWFSFPDLEPSNMLLDCFLKTRDYQWEEEIRFALFSKYDLDIANCLFDSQPV